MSGYFRYSYWGQANIPNSYPPQLPIINQSLITSASQTDVINFNYEDIIVLDWSGPEFSNWDGQEKDVFDNRRVHLKLVKVY